MYTHNHLDHCENFFGALRNLQWKPAARRLIAYLAVRRGPQWLNAHVGVLAGYLPDGWLDMPHHELIEDLDEQGITPEHCILV